MFSPSFDFNGFFLEIFEFPLIKKYFYYNLKKFS